VKEVATSRPPASQPFSARLRLRVRLALGPLVAAGERFVEHPNARGAYREYLISLYAVMRGIGAAMETALGRATELAPDDPVARPLAGYLAAHVEEERGHDRWVMDDLAALGVDRLEVTHRMPSPTVAALVGSQLYWATQVHPVAVLGYLAVAEGHPPTARIVERLRAATGDDPEAFRTLDEHAELDPTHGDELFELVDSLGLGPDLEHLVVVSAMSAAGLMAQALEDVLERVGPGADR
jgi:Iron-containing redox enzyme